MAIQESRRMREHSTNTAGSAGFSRRRMAVGVALLTASLATLVPAVVASAAGKSKEVVVDRGSMTSVVDDIGARTLWKQGYTGQGVAVAVIDTGAAPVPALSGADKVVAMADFSAEAKVADATYLDSYGHGTHITGIIAGRDPGADPSLATPDPTKFLGVAPDAQIVSVKTGDNSGMVDVSQIIAAIDWVIEHKDETGVRVLNLSYGTDSTQDYRIDPLSFAVERAWKAGIVVVTSVGNDGRGARRLADPATNPFVIAVAATAWKGNDWSIPSWSSSGDGIRNPDVSAPGTSITSLRSPGSRIDIEHPEGYVSETLFKGSGSSQAAAVVSGAAALLLSARPELTPDQVKAMLKSTAVKVKAGHQPRYQGDGIIQVDKALSAVLPASAAQPWAPANGNGTLEGSRGDAHVIVGTAELTGETTVTGGPWRHPWSGDAWAGTGRTDRTWRSDAWDGATWTGLAWRPLSWNGVEWGLGQLPETEQVQQPSNAWGSTLSLSGPTTTSVWDGRTWRDITWDGKTWRDVSWDGKTWREIGWADNEWSGLGWRIGEWS